MKKALTIAGSDCSGGAGIQADIKTMMANGVYAMSAITALTAQNTTGVFAISEVSPYFLKEELKAIFTDIYPDAVKIGMVSSVDLIDTIADFLKEHPVKDLVVDPVMVSTSGSKLIIEDAVAILEEKLFPMATLITPNIPEGEIIADMDIKNSSDMLMAAEKIYKNYGCNVLLKGGHSVNDANDLLYTKEGYIWINGEKINNPNTHGTGCSLSSAIAANLAKGYGIETSVRKGKNYLNGALKDMLDLGNGSGPLNHAFNIQGEY